VISYNTVYLQDSYYIILTDLLSQYYVNREKAVVKVSLKLYYIIND
jgi:hypothetical protein